jgi:hypothetical protein
MGAGPICPKTCAPADRQATSAEGAQHAGSKLRVERILFQVNLRDCKRIDLPKIEDPLGNLTFIEAGQHIPFPIRRVFYLYDVPGGAERAGHALKKCHQFLIAMSGSFDVILYDGKEKTRVHLNRSYFGLYVPPMVWREIDNFSSGSVCLAVASEYYGEEDYYRNYKDFLLAVATQAQENTIK